MTAPTKHAGVVVKDRHLAALIDSATAQGFRVEAATNGGHAKGTGLALYPPDPALPPIRFGVTTVTPRHVNNVRSALRAAGYTENTDQATTEESTVSRKNSGTRPSAVNPLAGLPSAAEAALNGKTAPTNAQDWLIETDDREERASRAGRVAAQVASTATGGTQPAIAALAGALMEDLVSWATDPSILALLGVSSGAKDAEEALALAAEQEARAERAEAALARAEEREQQARSDCGEALKRAEAAEWRAGELEAVLRPLRAFLGQSS